jgi:GNAT superfamily N-acetyltransferase
MFMCSNLKAAGIKYKGGTFEGEYYGHFSRHPEQLTGVIVHYWNGNIMMFARDEKILVGLAIHLKNKAIRPIAGVLGPNNQAECVIKTLGLSHENYAVNRKEKLYEINLSDLNETQISHPFTIVEAKDISKDLLVKWMQDYEVEALGAAKDAELPKRAEIKANGLIKGNCWILMMNTVPVSLSAFNACLDDMVQVGPVWTPPEHRNQGFARLLLAHTLVKNKRKSKALLFTDNPSAIKAYESLGFKPIGDYRLALLKKPLTLRNP